MNKGFGTLLITVVAVIMFINPNQVPSSSSATTTPSHSFAGQSSPPIQGRKVNEFATVICNINDDPTCAGCSQICPSDDLVGAVGAFFASRYKDEMPGAPHGAISSDAEYQVDLRKHWGVPPSAREGLQIIIAIVPDPIHTHLSLFFDRQIDAIEEASQEHGYLFARASLPWDSKPRPEPLDIENRFLLGHYTQAREQLPGLMIFRKATPSSDADFRASLFVFLVGETPTGGIHKQQFQNALRAIHDIRAEGAAPAVLEPLRILGPTFSGSLYSLMAELKKNLSFSNILVHSGTASSWDTIDWFKNYSSGPATLEFTTFHESDCYMLARLVKFAEVRGYTREQIALLSEDETAYGNQGSTKLAGTPESARDCKAETARRKCGNSSPCEYSNQVVHLYFPREISQLRGAYQRDVHDDRSNDSSGNGTPRSTLRMNLEDSGTDDDSIPPYSNVQTPLSQEAVMFGIVSSLLRHHAEFVVVQATNPLDTLFLSRYLRTAYPQGRTVTVGTDLLFQQEVDDPKLQGILALGTYPLLPGVDDEIAVSPNSASQIHRDRVFPAGYSVGTYNAMLSLLEIEKSSCNSQHRHQSTGSCAGNLPDTRYAEYGWPGIAGDLPQGRNALAPPLWLTVLGRYGYWPLAVLDSEPFAPQQSRLPSNIHPVNGPDKLHHFKPHVPLPWKVLCCMCIFLVLGYLFLLWRGSFVSSSESMANFAPVKHTVRSSILFIAGLLFVIMIVSLMAPTVRWFGYPEFLILGLGLAIVLIVFAVLCSGDLLLRGARKRAGVFLVLSFVIALIPLFWWFASESTANLDFYRYVHVTAGVSPLIPFLLLLGAGLWWIWYSLAGLALQDRRAPLLPTLKDLGVLAGHDTATPPEYSRFLALSRETNVDLMNALKPVSLIRDVYLVPLVAAMMFIFINLTSLRPVQSLEGIWFDRSYALALTFVVFVLLSSLFRLVIIWIKFRDLLLSLDRLPLRRGFARLTGFAWKPMWRLGGGAIGDYFRLFSREFESLMYLKSFLTSNDKQLIDAIEEVEKLRKDLSNHILQNKVSPEPAPQEQSEPSQKSRLDRLYLVLRSLRMGDDANRIDYLMDKVEDLQKAISHTAGVALEYLSVRWPNDLQAALFAIPTSSKEKCHVGEVEESKETKQAEQFVCLVFLNFILTVLLRIRVLIMTVAGLFVFALLSFGSYPFEPKASFHSIMVMVFLIAVGMVAFVFAQMHRDATLSHITDTTPGELGLDFWLRLASFIAVPLLGLLAVQFPQVNSIFSSWMQPALQAFK